jgi:type II secretory pathway component GspD/PulD (secretin)
MVSLKKLFIAAGMIFCFVFTVPLRAQGAPGMEGQKSPDLKVSMEFQEAALKDVLRILSKQSGINFVASEDIADKKVTLYLDGVGINDALNSIIQANNLAVKKAPDSDIYIVHKPLDTERELMVKVYRLKYATVIPLLGEKADVFGPVGGVTGSSSTGQSGGTSSGDTSGGSSSGSSSSASSGIAGIAGFGSESSSSTGSSSSEGRGILSAISTILSDQGTVTADPRTNSIIVVDTAAKIKLADKIIEELDIVVPQVVISAEIIEVSLDTLRRIGLEYGSSADGTFATYTGPTRASEFPFSGRLNRGLEAPTDSMQMGILDLTDLNIVLKLLANEQDARYIASPKVLTVSNETAEIHISSDTAVGTKTTSQTTTGSVSEEAERIETGTILRVTPQINSDSSITMVIEPEVSRAVQSTFFAAFVDPHKRSARTTVRVGDGETVVIAGLISRQDSQTVRKVPLLGDIPILGLPFKRTYTAKVDTEILVFITPRLLEKNKAKEADALRRTQEQAVIVGEQFDIAKDKERLNRQKKSPLAGTLEQLAR